MANRLMPIPRPGGRWAVRWPPLEGGPELLSWGIEFGTCCTFFSLEHPERGKVLEDTVVRTEAPDGRFVLAGRVRLPFAEVEVEDVCEATSEGFVRRTRFTPAKGAELCDVVQRYVFRAESVSSVAGPGRSLKFRGDNRYNRFPGATALSITDRAGRMWTASLAHKAALGYLLEPYWRDSTSEAGADTCWVLHVRCVCAEPEVLGLVGSSRLWQGPVPGFLAWPVTVLRLDGGRLLRLRETSWPRAPFQTVGARRLGEGQSFIIEATWCVAGSAGGPGERQTA